MDNLYAKEEDKPTQKKFFVLSVRTPKMMEGLCIAIAHSPREIAEFLVGRYKELNNHEYYIGTIILSDINFRRLVEGNFMRERGMLPLSNDDRPVKLYVAELPIFGRCKWWHLGLELYLAGQMREKNCCEIGTLVAGELSVLYPDAYRLLVDDNYKEDKEDK